MEIINNQGGGLLGNNTNNQGGGLFGNNTNNQGGGLFGNNKTNNQGGLFGNISNNNSNQGGGLFGNSSNNNQGGGLFGNTTNQGGGLFNNNNNSNSIFGNSNNNTGGGLFSNNTNSNSLFSNNNNNLNSTNATSLFGNNNSNTNQGNSLFGNNNSSNNNSGNSLFGNNNSSGGGLFGNNNTNQSGGGLFGNNNTANKNNTNSLFGNSNNNGSIFGNNINNNNNTGGLFANNNNNNNSLFGQANNTGNSLFGNNTNANNNQGQGLFGNTNGQGINNMNNANNVNVMNNYTPYGGLTLEDIVNPLEYLNSSRTLKLSPEDEILSRSITEAVRKQKTVNQFLEDLDKKYKKDENIYENNDILDNYGTYLGNAHNSYVQLEQEIPSLSRSSSNSFKNYNRSKWRNINMNNSYEESSYYNEALSNSMSKINNIYEEYERYKNKFKANNQKFYQKSKYFNSINNFENNNSNLNFNLNHASNINNIHSNIINNQNKNHNSNIAKNNALYQKNILELSKLTSNELKTSKNVDYNNSNESDEDDDEILVMNNNNENENNENVEDIKINGITPVGLNSPKTIDLIIKYRLPDKENVYSSGKNMNILRLENVNQLIKIQALKNEIKTRINNELKLKELNNSYSIENISLLIPGSFLLDTKSLSEYDLENFDFTIQAFITYSSITKKEKKLNKKEKNNKKIILKENELVPSDLVPILTKEGYKCSPSILELSRKTANELRKVSGFKIYNKYGEVEFKEPVNLLGLNLDNQITIERNLIDTGDKLNYWSLFKLYNFQVEENGLNKYKINLAKSGGNFVQYKNNEIIWEYKKTN